MKKTKKVGAVFIDRDGVIVVDKGYVHKIEDFEFIERVPQGLKKISDSGFKLIVVTNQAGIGRGHYTEGAYFSFMRHIINELKKLGVKILDFYHCPHHPDEKCECRKPKPGMIIKAIKEHNVDVENSYMIGDKWGDMLAGRGAGLKTILVNNGENARDVEHKTDVGYIAKDLVDAASFIEKDTD